MSRSFSSVVPSACRTHNRAAYPTQLQMRPSGSSSPLPSSNPGMVQMGSERGQLSRAAKHHLPVPHRKNPAAARGLTISLFDQASGQRFFELRFAVDLRLPGPPPSNYVAPTIPGVATVSGRPGLGLEIGCGREHWADHGIVHRRLSESRFSAIFLPPMLYLRRFVIFSPHTGLRPRRSKFSILSAAWLERHASRLHTASVQGVALVHVASAKLSSSAAERHSALSEVRHVAVSELTASLHAL